jgi:hypothetical protein
MGSTDYAAFYGAVGAGVNEKLSDMAANTSLNEIILYQPIIRWNWKRCWKIQLSQNLRHINIEVKKIK